MSIRHIEVKVIPNARKNHIEQEGNLYKVHIMAPAVDGKANKALIELLADHFQVRKSAIEIMRGEKSRLKYISIEC